MQTIENSLLQVSVDENGAQMNSLVSKTSNYNYLNDKDKQENVTFAFPMLDHDENWALKLPWTVVDKGDSRVSLTLIDTAESYKVFPYHFEVMVTYALEGNQVNITYHVKNNSNKEMPFSIESTIPLFAGWDFEENVNKIVLTGPDNREASGESTDFKLKVIDNKIKCISEDNKLTSETDQDLNLSFTLA